jgi:uncharacterized protein (TIGR03435 family)
MTRHLTAVATLILSTSLGAQTPTPRPKFEAFDVATIKATDMNTERGRFITMKGPHRWIAQAYTLKLMIAAAYELNPRTISGGLPWVESDHYDIEAITPSDVQPNHDEQMAMLRKLLTDRFSLTFHREPKDFSIYELQIAKGGPKLTPSTAPADDPPKLISTVYPQKIELPAHNATMRDFVSMMQRAMLDRPVVDKTGLTGRYDFNLQWAPDETQFGGEVPVAPSDAPAAPLFTAIQEQLGLKLVATRGAVDTFIVDRAERPTAN